MANSLGQPIGAVIYEPKIRSRDDLLEYLHADASVRSRLDSDLGAELPQDRLIGVALAMENRTRTIRFSVAYDSMSDAKKATAILENRIKTYRGLRTLEGSFFEKRCTSIKSRVMPVALGGIVTVTCSLLGEYPSLFWLSMVGNEFDYLAVP